MKIAFICVNFNNSEITNDYIKNVLKIKQHHEIKVIVVDNASNEKDVIAMKNYVAAYDKNEVVLLTSPINLGYFKGLNVGISYASNNGFNQYQVVGNNDISFDVDFINVLEGLTIGPDDLVIAPDVLTSGGIHENPHVITKMSWLRKLKYDIYFSNYHVAKFITKFYSAERKHKTYDKERKYIHMGIGALYVLTPNFFKHFKTLWDDVFLYGEEAILAGQVQSVNGKTLYEPSLKCLHSESASTSKMNSKSKYEIIQKSYKIYKKYL